MGENKSVSAKDLRTKSNEELESLVQSTTSQLFDARFENHSNRLDNTSSLRRMRREIARLKTVLCERQKAGAPAGGDEQS